VRSLWYEGEVGVAFEVEEVEPDVEVDPVEVDPEEVEVLPATEPALDDEMNDDALLAAPQPAIPRVASRSTASLALFVPRTWCNLASGRRGIRQEG
jgi:hypothetical protein